MSKQLAYQPSRPSGAHNQGDYGRRGPGVAGSKRKNFFSFPAVRSLADQSPACRVRPQTIAASRFFFSHPPPSASVPLDTQRGRKPDPHHVGVGRGSSPNHVGCKRAASLDRFLQMEGGDRWNLQAQTRAGNEPTGAKHQGAPGGKVKRRRGVQELLTGVVPTAKLAGDLELHSRPFPAQSWRLHVCPAEIRARRMPIRRPVKAVREVTVGCLLKSRGSMNSEKLHSFASLGKRHERPAGCVGMDKPVADFLLAERLETKYSAETCSGSIRRNVTSGQAPLNLNEVAGFGVSQNRE